jgi:hypothetical protein
MNLIEIIPQMTRCNEKICDRISCRFVKKPTKSERYALVIGIGKNILDKLSISDGDRIKVFYNADKHNQLFLKKSDIFVGFKLIFPTTYRKSGRITLTWKNKPLPPEKNYFTVVPEFYDGGVLINL